MQVLETTSTGTDKATKVFTTIDENTPPFSETFTIFSKRKHYEEQSKFSEGEQTILRRALENLNMGVDEIPQWLYKAMKLKLEGKKVLFLNDRLSLRTYKRATHINREGLWDMVMCEHDMRHDDTKDVREDYGEKVPHDGSLDLWLRNRVYHSQMKMIIKVAHAYPEIWKDLEARDGQEIVVSYENDTLRLYLPETDTTYELAVGRIKLVPENN